MRNSLKGEELETILKQVLNFPDEETGAGDPKSLPCELPWVSVQPGAGVQFCWSQFMSTAFPVNVDLQEFDGSQVFHNLNCLSLTQIFVFKFGAGCAPWFVFVRKFKINFPNLFG